MISRFISPHHTILRTTSTRTPLRAFNSARFRDPEVKKPASTILRSTTRIASVLPGPRNAAAERLALRIPTTASHVGDRPSTLPLSRAAGLLSRQSSPRPGRDSTALKGHSKALQRDFNVLSDWELALQNPPRPSAHITVVRSSLRDFFTLVEDAFAHVGDVLGSAGRTAWKIVLGTLGFLFLGVFILFFLKVGWEKVTGETVEQKHEFCSRCGKQLLSEGWYWKENNSSSDDIPMQDWKKVCGRCSRALRGEGGFLVYAGVAEWYGK